MLVCKQAACDSPRGIRACWIQGCADSQERPRRAAHPRTTIRSILGLDVARQPPREGKVPGRLAELCNKAELAPIIGQLLWHTEQLHHRRPVLRVPDANWMSVPERMKDKPPRHNRSPYQLALA